MMKISLYFLLSGALFLAACSSSTSQPVASAPAATAASAAAHPGAGHGPALQELLAVTGRPDPRIRRIGILLYDGYTTLDAMGPYQVLGELLGPQVFFVAKRKGLVRNMSGLAVQVDHDFAGTDSLDVLVVPGGFDGTYRAARDSATLAWIKKIDRTTRYTTSVCTGAWVLGAAGLLQGRPATTHWYGKTRLEQDYGARYEPQRYVRSGKYWTSAGVTAGMDLSLALIRDLAGEKYTQAAMLDLEYAPAPPVVGGTERNTPPAIVRAMRAMYDGGMQAVEQADQSQASAGADPVCGMSVAAPPAATATYRGRTYRFCSAGCQARFVADPARYVAQTAAKPR